jgi:hypothetical protein
MSLLQDWLPPSPGNWTLLVTTFTYFPVVRLPLPPIHSHFA